VTLLLERGANVNAQAAGLSRTNLTPLHLAARNGHTAVCRLLLAAGADQTMLSSSGKTALSLALAEGHEECGVVLTQQSDSCNALR
jgi:ankyrin repeat protein